MALSGRLYYLLRIWHALPSDLPLRQDALGVDLGGEYGNPIVAAADGTVIKVEEPVEGQNTGSINYGNYCVIDHGNGICTLYGHCRDVYVSVGDYVVAGQTIAECGSTGTSSSPHVHFEVRVNGQKVDPVPYIT